MGPTIVSGPLPLRRLLLIEFLEDVVTSANESRLLDPDAIGFFCDGQDGVPHFLNPKGHVISNADPRGITQSIPKIFRRSVPIGVFLQIITDSLEIKFRFEKEYLKKRLDAEMIG